MNYKKSLLANNDGGFQTINNILHHKLKLSSFDDNDGYINHDYIQHLINWTSNNTSNSNKEYLITHSKYIKSVQYLPSAGLYELIGMTLLNSEHAISFVKTGKSDSSWSGIDSNRNANDDNYKLEDIIYKNYNSLQNQLPLLKGDEPQILKNDPEKQYKYNLENENRRNKNYYNDNTDNTFLAKVYKHYGYKPLFLLWKKVNSTEDEQITLIKK